MHFMLPTTQFCPWDCLLTLHRHSSLILTSIRVKEAAKKSQNLFDRGDTGTLVQQKLPTPTSSKKQDIPVKFFALELDGSYATDYREFLPSPGKTPS